MNEEPTKADSPAPPAGKRRWTKRLTAGLGFGALLALVIAGLFIEDAADQELAWLTPAEFAQHTRPGPFAAIKNKLKSWTAPIWGRLRSPQPRIKIDAKLLTLASTWSETGLGAAATNANGLRAWVLSSEDATILRQRIATNSSAKIIANPSMVLNSGAQASSVTTQVGPVGAPRTGITVDFLPRYTAGAVSLAVNVTATERPAAETNVFIVRTNFAAACQVRIPHGGSLVLDGGGLPAGNGPRHWMIISPVALDANNQPIRTKR